MPPEIKKPITIFVTLLGIVSAIVGILATDNSIRIPAFIVLFVTVVGLAMWIVLRRWQRKSSHQFPLVNMNDLAARYSVDQATPQEVKWIAQLEERAYPRDAVPEQILKEWYDSNHEGFSILRMNGEKIGHIDILPLRSKSLGLFIEGTIIERELRGDSLYQPGDRDLIRDLYVESIIVRPPGGRSNASDMALLHLLCNFIPLTRRMAHPDNIENIYAVAASAEGEDFMKDLGFELIKSGHERKDKHNLYVARFAELKLRIADLCRRRPGYRRSQN